MTWYNTGTVKTTANSAVVTGTSTAWTTSGLRAGDMLLIGYNTVSPRPFEIKSIDSATQITLVIAFPVAVTAAAYVGIPMLSGDRTAITMTLAQQVTKAFADNQAMQAVWQTFYSGSGTVTLTMPDGSTVTGSSFLKLTADIANKATLVNGVVPLNQGGTGQSSPFGTAVNTFTQGNDVRLVNNVTFNTNNQDTLLGSMGAGNMVKAFRNNGNVAAPWDIPNSSPSLFIRTADTFAMISFSFGSGQLKVFTGANANGWMQSYEIWNTRNTTVDGNGFIKRASPIARLSSNPSEMQSDYMKDFLAAGIAAVNEEAKGVVGERISEGVYAIKGSLGLAEEGWTIEVPQDVNGNRLLFVKAITAGDGTITVSTFKRKFCTESAMVIAGEPMDIPDGRWIDLRLQMPDKAETVPADEENKG